MARSFALKYAVFWVLGFCFGAIAASYGSLAVERMIGALAGAYTLHGAALALLAVAFRWWKSMDNEVDSAYWRGAHASRDSADRDPGDEQ